ncbi:MAG TPA: hypothetical protein VFG50_10855 [Rhodothermales bacterium]|nr:hypothetical protein [Rhodothermales bacterium]
MDSPLAPHSLLQDIYVLGNQMIDTLETEDVETFGTLMRERGILLEQLTSRTDRNALSRAWAGFSAQFEKQSSVLERAMTQLESHLERELSTVGRYHDAHRSYAGANTRAGILHANLHG